MKKIALLLLILAVGLSIMAACRDAETPDAVTTDAVTTDAVTTDAVTTDGETTAPETEVSNVSVNGVTVEGLNGWFEYGGALIYRDKYEYVGTRDSMEIAMAKNEMEGFQYVLLSDKSYDNLRCEVSALTDGKGNTLEGTVFYAHNYYINKTARWIDRGYVPEILIEQDDPYIGGSFDLVAMRAKTLYIRYLTDKNTVPGTYTGRLEIKQGDTVLKSHDISVKVWDIYYDDKSECLTLYQYGYIRDDQGWGGPGPDNAPNMDPAIVDNAYEARQQYVDFMLENRFSPWQLPIEDELLSEDFELVKKYMDNPRLTVTYLYQHKTIFQQSEVAKEHGWFDKLAVQVGDEPKDLGTVKAYKKAAENLNYRSGITRFVAAFGMTGADLDLLAWMVPEDGPNVAEYMAEYSTMHCLNALDFYEGNPLSETLLKLKRERGDDIIWYVCGSQAESEDMINFLVGTPCTEKRILFWQQYQNDVDGYLQFHTMVWNREQDFWAEDHEEKRWKPAASIDGPDGDGLMIYWHPTTKEPLGSLTVESNRDGIEDFQLLRMAEYTLGKEVAMSYAERISTAVNVYTKDASLLAQVRQELGDALEAALLS